MVEEEELVETDGRIVEGMFAPCSNTLINTRSGELVLDDELIGSHARDIESKNHSDRKAGKHNPCAETAACAFT